MYSERAIERIRVIDKKIGFIENIVENVIEHRLPIIKRGTEKVLASSI